MGGRKEDRYRSSYDPMFSGGKIMREPDRRELEREREREQHRLGGCGNPDCPRCNPETANMTTGRPSSPYRGVMDESLFRSMRDSIDRMITVEMGMGRPIFAGSGGPEFVAYDPATPEKPKGPPPAYAKARKEVENWLCKAPEQAFEDIVGNEAALEQLKDAIQAPVKHKALYEAYGMKMPKGAMLSGPPGCGKTMFAKAAAAEMKRLYGDKVEFLSIAGSELQSMFIGQTEAYIRSIFNFAREYQAHHGHPLLVFMDEAEVLLPDRTGRVRRVASWEESQVATFLAEMDGVRENGAFLLLATNRPEVIDQAVLRDGRCDFKIVVKRPTREAVEVILQKNFAGVLTGADGVEDLVFAALESLYDPHRVLVEAHVIAANLESRTVGTYDKHFLLEHIISGAIAASIPTRSVRSAFARDKADGVAKGVLVADVLASVQVIFEENKGLEHTWAIEEFKAEFMREIKADLAAPDGSKAKH